MQTPSLPIVEHCRFVVLAAVGQGVPLRLNSVLKLDGKAAYVALPSEIFEGLEEATVELWVKWTELKYSAQIFTFGSTWGRWGSPLRKYAGLTIFGLRRNARFALGYFDEPLRLSAQVIESRRLIPGGARLTIGLLSSGRRRTAGSIPLSFRRLTGISTTRSLCAGCWWSNRLGISICGSRCPSG